MISDSIMNYVLTHSSAPDALLDALERETHLKTMSPNMLSGAFQGRLLAMMSIMIKPKTIVEIGTFTGYATHCLAEGLREDGLIHTFEINPERESLIRKYFEMSPRASQLKLYIQDAKEGLPSIEEPFDLVFIDAAKKDNEWYYEYCLSRLSDDGWIFIDNILWKGRVLSPIGDTDAETIDSFNQKIAKDSRVKCLQLPLRDGLVLIRKS
ncbi:MAG: O-methyltransferase [Saprospiraceae bacterium]